MKSYHFQHQTKWIISGAWGLALIVLFFFGSANHVSAATPSQQVVCQNFDITYLLDLSGSMGWPLDSSGQTRLEAAQDAIVEMNGVLAANGEGVEASLLTWTGGNIQVAVDMTSDFNTINNTVNNLWAGGLTPTASSFQATRNHLLTHSDPEREQIVLFMTDGVPTLDLTGYSYDHWDVSDVEVMISEGVFRTPSQVRTSGVYYWDSYRYAGHPLADAMVEIDATVNQVENLTIHSIAILGDNFKQDILKYASYRSGGDYYPATTASELATSIQQAVYEGNCVTTLNLNVGHVATFYLGGTAQLMDPNVSVTGENENVRTATIQISENFDATHDRLYIGNTPSDSGTIGALTWWYEAATGTLQIVGIDTPQAYQDAMRQIRYTNSALSPARTNMNNRTLDVSITSAITNNIDNGNLSGQTFVELIHIDGTEYGDAPASYGEAGQRGSMLLRLGALVDTEAAPLFSADASGDDSNNVDDEDGVSITGVPLLRGAVGEANVNVTNNLNEPAYVQIWADLDQNGFFDTYDTITGNSFVIPANSGTQTYPISFVIPGDTACGVTFARVRLSTEIATPTGMSADVYGEVEDYVVPISCDPPVVGDDFDYGDAPASYGGAEVALVEDMYLGASVDAEGAALHSTGANGDDVNDLDDENGATFAGTAILGETVSVEIRATNLNFVNSFVTGWADWNQDGTFTPDEQFVVNRPVPRNSNNRRINTSFTVPVDAACNDTYIRIRMSGSPVDATESAIGGETEDYIFDVNCDADLRIEFETEKASDPSAPASPIQLEDTLILTAVAYNDGPNYAPNVTSTVTLMPDLDILSWADSPDWNCTLNGTETQLDCTHNRQNYPGFAAGTSSVIVTVEARVPGIFQPNVIAGNGEIRSSFPDPNTANNTASYAVDVEKVWEGKGIPYEDLIFFTHAIYDDSLPISGGPDNKRDDYMGDDLIQNPFQVPLKLLPGVELSAPPELTAEFCLTHTTPGCDSSDAIITGTVKINSYTITEMVLQDVDGDGNPVNPSSPINELATSFTADYGLGSEGRYVEIDPARCDLWRFNYDTGACEAMFNTFRGYSDTSLYNWSQNEYFELILSSSGGRSITCSAAVSECINQVAKPGIYRFGGTIQAQLIFEDTAITGHDRIPTQVIDFTYPVNIYVRIVSTFVEPD